MQINTKSHYSTFKQFFWNSEVVSSLEQLVICILDLTHQKKSQETSQTLVVISHKALYNRLTFFPHIHHVL